MISDSDSDFRFAMTPIDDGVFKGELRLGWRGTSRNEREREIERLQACRND